MFLSSLLATEAFLEHSITFVVGFFAKKVNSEKSLTIFAKMLHHRLLVGLQIQLLVILPKKSHLKDISPYVKIFLLVCSVFIIQ